MPEITSLASFKSWVKKKLNVNFKSVQDKIANFKNWGLGRCTKSKSPFEPWPWCLLPGAPSLPCRAGAEPGGPVVDAYGDHGPCPPVPPDSRTWAPGTGLDVLPLS